MVQYAGDPTTYPVDYTIADDAVPPTAAVFNVGLEALGDRTNYLKSHVGQVAALTFQTQITANANFNVLKYSEALARWFGLGDTADYLTSTQQVLTWGSTTEIPVPQRLGNVVWDFDIDATGNLVAIDQAIDNTLRRTAAGAYAATAIAGNVTAEPNIIWEPVTGNWIVAYTTGAVLWTYTSTAASLFAASTSRTPPAFPGAARVTLGTNGAGRVVMQGFSGTNTYFSYSDNGGVSWSAVTTLALGFTYTNTSGAHHPRPVWNGKAWVAVGYNQTTGVCRIFTSPDGVTWSIGSSLTSTAINHIIGLGGLVVGTTANAGGITSGSIVFSADNGATWRKTEGTFVLSAIQPRGMAATSSRFVLLASNKIYPGNGFLEGGGLVT